MSRSPRAGRVDAPVWGEVGVRPAHTIRPNRGRVDEEETRMVLMAGPGGEGRTFADLVEDTGSDDAARAFARRYVRMLDGRVSRVWDSLGQADVENAVDALLSLRSSSLTVGANDLAALATDMLSDLRDLDLHHARARAVHLRGAAHHAQRTLSTQLGEGP